MYNEKKKQNQNGASVVAPIQILGGFFSLSFECNKLIEHFYESPNSQEQQQKHKRVYQLP